MFNKDVEKFDHGKGITEEELYWLARKRIEIKKGFLVHFGVYCAVNASFIGMSLVSGSFWAIWPMLGWGIGLASHFVTTAVKLNLDYNANALNNEMEYLRKRLNQNNTNNL